LNLLRSNVGRTWNNGLSRRGRHKSGLNSSMKSRSRSILRAYTAILNDMTLLAIIEEFLATMFCNVPNFLATINIVAEI
jgi:hypothetical protein